MVRVIELRRHTDNEGDVLTPEGVHAALEIGRGLDGRYQFMASSGAQRATQTVACLIAGLGEVVPGGVIVEDGIRSRREDEWRAAYSKARAGDLESFEMANPELVSEDSVILASGLTRLFELLDDGQRALAVGHSPTNEAAVHGLTGGYIPPMGKGDGILVVLDGDEYHVAEIE